MTYYKVYDLLSSNYSTSSSNLEHVIKSCLKLAGCSLVTDIEDFRVYPTYYNGAHCIHVNVKKKEGYKYEYIIEKWIEETQITKKKEEVFKATILSKFKTTKGSVYLDYTFFNPIDKDDAHVVLVNNCKLIVLLESYGIDVSMDSKGTVFARTSLKIEDGILYKYSTVTENTKERIDIC